jgi:signal transduction histidine kinase
MMRLSQRLRWWLLAFGIWTLFPLLTAMQSALYAAYEGQPIDWGRILPLRLADWYTCALFTPVCFWLARRFRFERATWVRSAAVHLAVISPIVVVKYVLFLEVARVLAPADNWALGRTLAGNFVSESIAFWSLLGIVHAIEYHRRLREREVSAARLEAELASARLDALSAQLQPHFLFNTLHSVSTLMHRDVDAADDMLTHLGDLLHRTLKRGDRHEIALSDELEMLRHYLEIMQIRFQDRLSIEIDVDPSLHTALVPPLVLQPLVENAIQHGISRRPGAGKVEIGATASDGMLEIRVRDDGEGPAESQPRDGIGLSNTRRRLRQLYGDNQSLELLPAVGNGVVVVLRLPLTRPSATLSRKAGEGFRDDPALGADEGVA